MNKDVLLFLHFKTTSPISQLLKIFDKGKYCHVSGIIDNQFCDLNPLDKRDNEGDYHMRFIHNKPLFIKQMRKQADVFAIPYDFTVYDKLRMLEFWKKKIKNKAKYGYGRIPLLFIMKPFLNISRRYYIKHNKPLPLHFAGFWNKDACSNIWDRTIKLGGYDICPEFDERVLPPNFIANALKGCQI